jgi:hypothetical protein
MIRVELEFELVEQFAAFQGQLARGIKQAVTNAVEEGADEARKVHRYVDRSGDLTRSIDGHLESFDHLGAVGILQAKAKYASFVENGTKPHRIVVRRKKALHWEDGGVHYFAKSVNHPGTAPRPFMGPAYLKAERVLERDIEVAVANAERELT